MLWIKKWNSWCPKGAGRVSWRHGYVNEIKQSVLCVTNGWGDKHINERTPSFPDFYGYIHQIGKIGRAAGVLFFGGKGE